MRQILIVDDSPTIRRMVRASLVPLSASADFVEAGSGLEAIERLALSDVALMVLDLNMPDMHGLEVLSFVRSHQKYRQLPIIVLTTRGDEASRGAALQAGATCYLTKPFAPTVLAAEALALLGDPAAAADARVGGR
jgi:two-component system chemotaxis response regulator CheY